MISHFQCMDAPISSNMVPFRDVSNLNHILKEVVLVQF